MKLILHLEIDMIFKLHELRTFAVMLTYLPLLTTVETHIFAVYFPNFGLDNWGHGLCAGCIIPQEKFKSSFIKRCLQLLKYRLFLYIT